VTVAIVYLFDIDGTLLSAGGAGRRAFNAVWKELYQIDNGCDGLQFGGRTDRWLVDQLYQLRCQREATSTEIDDFLNLYLTLLEQEFTQQPPTVYPNVLSALQWLGVQPHTYVGIATGNIAAAAQLKLEFTSLASHFSFGGWGCDSADRAQVVAHAKARGMATLPSHISRAVTVVVGDTIHDISAARANQAQVWAITTGGDSRDKLGDADAVFDCLSELPKQHQLLRQTWI
jgi:phosphoglycolate phosphatase